MNAKAIQLANDAATLAEITGKEKSSRFVNNLSAKITELMTTSFEQGRTEGLAQGKKACKTFMLEHGISGAKVVEFLKHVNL